MREKTDDGREIRQLAFSPDGKTLAALVTSWKKDSNVKVLLWDVPSRKQVATLRCRADWLGWILDFTPDGKALVSSCQRPGKKYGSVLVAVEVWDLKSRKVRLTIDLPEGRGGRGLITRDGKHLLVGGVEAALYDLKTGKEAAVLKGRGMVARLALSKDGKWLATAHPGGKVGVWDLPKRKLLRTIDADPKEVKALAFSADGEALVTMGGATAEKNMAFVWGRAKGEERHRVDLFKHELYMAEAVGVAFTPDGKTVILAGPAMNDGVFLWDPAGGKVWAGLGGLVTELRAHHNCVALSPDGKTLATGETGGVVRLREVAWPKPRK